MVAEKKQIVTPGADSIWYFECFLNLKSAS